MFDFIVILFLLAFIIGLMLNIAFDIEISKYAFKYLPVSIKIEKILDKCYYDAFGKPMNPEYIYRIYKRCLWFKLYFKEYSDRCSWDESLATVFYTQEEAEKYLTCILENRFKFTN